MAVDFEAEGLLEGLEGEEREARLELLTQLHDAGCSLEELKQAVEEDRLALLPLEQAIGGDRSRYTEPELAERAGVDLDFLRAHARALGFPQPDENERVFGDADARAAELIRRFRDGGLPEEGMLEISRVLGQSMARLAAAVGSVFGDAFIQPGDTERDVGLRYAEAARELAPQMTPLLEYVLQRHQLELIKQIVVDRAGLAEGRLPGGREMTVCFADLVGFTRLGEDVSPAELGSVAGHLTELATDVATPPVRLVKMIGDAAMLVAPEPDPVLAAALELVEAADARGENFPQLRAGVACGEAIGRGGDWYGRPVNLASRITAVAYPGSVLATNEVREAADGDYRWSEAGLKRFKGIEGRVGLNRVRRDGEAEDGSPD
jgi:adenylate cyclase